MEILAVNVKGPMVVISIGALDTVDLEELPDSRERAGAPVLWLSCEGKIDVCELFCDNSYLSAILDRQRLLVAAPVDLRTKKTESFSPQRLKGFWAKLKIKNTNIVVTYPTVTTKNSKKNSQKATVLSVLGRSRIPKSLVGKHLLTLGPESGKIWWMKKR